MENMENCPYCGSPNIILKENGEYVCTNCGTVIGVVQDPGYGDSPSMTRREYFAQFQPGSIKTGDLRARLQLLKLEKSMREYSREDLLNYVLECFLEPLKQFNSEKVRELKLEIIQEVRNILSRIGNDPITIIYATYAVLLEVGIYVPEDKLRNLLKKVSEEGEIPRTTIRQVKKSLIALGHNLVLNVQSSIRLYGEFLGLSNLAIARALREVLKITGTPISIVIRALHNVGVDLSKIATILGIPLEKAYQHIQKVSEKKEVTVRRLTIADHDHFWNGQTSYHVDLQIWKTNQRSYVIFTEKLTRQTKVEITVDNIKLRFTLKPIRVKKRTVMGTYINKIVGELLYRRFGNGPIKARVVSWLGSESSQE